MHDDEYRGSLDQTQNMHDSSFDYQTQQAEPMTAWYRPVEKQVSRKFIVTMLVVCMIASSALGFAGGYVSNSLTQTGGGDTEILYESVVRNVANSDNASQPLTIKNVAATVKEAVVEIRTEVIATSMMGQITRPGAGSGVIISADGSIVTNNHVVSSANNIIVRLSNGKEYPATVVGADSQTDLAILKIDATGLTPAILGDSSKLSVGDDAVVIGNPLGLLGGTVTQGIISALDRSITLNDGTTMTLLQTDAAVNPGNSGGGLFNLYGELVGIINAKSSGTDIEGIGFAIPINTAKPVIESLMTSGYVKGRVGLGVSVVDITDAFTAMQYQVNQTGLYIAEPGDTQFKTGDRIISLDGKPVTDLASLKTLLTSYKEGDKAKVTVVRGNETVTLTHTLVELKS